MHSCFFSVKPVMHELVRHVVNEGKNTTWKCPVEGTYDTKVVWYKEDDPLVNKPNKVVSCFQRRIAAS